MAFAPDQVDDIKLGRISEFRLGDALIEPTLRRISLGERHAVIEPRLVQVLVALVRAEGAVVSRDDLISACWGGLAVGDNAIHRAISRLREAMAEIGLQSHRIETVPRVGYRLVKSDAAEMDVQPPSARSAPWLARLGRTWPLAAAATLVAAGVGIAAWRGGPSDRVPQVVVAAGSDPALAEGLRQDLPELTGGRIVRISPDPSGGAARRADIVALADSQAAGAATRVVVSLSDANGAVIWSKSAYSAHSDKDGVRAQASGAASTALNCALDARRGRVRLEGPDLSSFVAACVRLTDGPDEASRRMLEGLTARQPDFALGWGLLALCEAELGGSADDQPGRSQTIRGAQRAAALRHLAMAEAKGVRKGLAAAVRSTLVGLDRPGEKLRLIEQGLLDDPSYPLLYVQQATLFLDVGRLADAVPSAKTAVALEPGDIRSRESLVYALEYAGWADLARQELEGSERLWPDSALIRNARLGFDVRFASPEQALRKIDDDFTVHPIEREVYLGSVRSLIMARARPTPANVAKALRDARALRQWSHPTAWTIQALVELGKTDEALGILEDPRYINGYGAGILFRPYMRTLRLDPRFMRVLARAGLTRFWRETGLWPDFCNDAGLRYDCRTEAARAEAELAAEAPAKRSA